MTALDDLVDALQNAQAKVFRFEGRQDYPDDELWQAHQQGQWWEDTADLTDWCTLVSTAVDRGVTWQRVRVVTEPWTPYTRWEIEQHYPHNLRAGEDVRLARTAKPWRCSDFWLVDDECAWILDYDRNGVMRPVAAGGPAVVCELVAWKDEALAASVPLAAVGT